MSEIDLDLVEELVAVSYALPQDRSAGEWQDPPVNVCTRAAKEIASLRAERDALRGALAQRDDTIERLTTHMDALKSAFADLIGEVEHEIGGRYGASVDGPTVSMGVLSAARALLTPAPTETEDRPWLAGRSSSSSQS